MSIENEVLITFLRAKPTAIGVKTVHARMGARLVGVETFEFADVRKVVSRLLNLGHIRVTGEEQTGVDMYPAYTLTSAGELAAQAAAHQHRNETLAGTHKLGSPGKR